MNAKYLPETLQVKKTENQNSTPSLTAIEIQQLFQYKSLSSAHKLINRVNRNKSRLIVAAFIDQTFLNEYNKRANKLGIAQFSTTQYLINHISKAQDTPENIEIKKQQAGNNDEVAELKATIAKLEKEKALTEQNAKQITDEYERLVAQLNIEKEDILLDLQCEKQAYNKLYQCTSMHIQEKEKYKLMATIMAQEIRRANNSKIPIINTFVEHGGQKIIKTHENIGKSLWNRPLDLSNFARGMSFHKRS